MSSEKPNQLIAAAVGVGLSKDTFGIIMEYSGFCSQQEVEAEIKRMVEEAFTSLNFVLEKLMIKSVEHRVERVGCVFAAVQMWS